ncbi:AGE family epimerase/isomerase [Escherichia albertii]|uniref:AGE family epimerase/isomerase n=1 Tax=Escherichia albertii TaxID=208962 RepID=UPI002119F06C|nr:AGE family epimerase/isomerase [Escherichia albertii]MCQ8908111.1 AGE family epimerase/isomerase [Escherichia albertii]MCQ8957279.1 AGE family epimerase/isomerase [Escherichia albertii]MCQ8988907.1 AGE family epimerase/isomerase [Escherichia albertii]UUL28039.1 AGE family epimerase/isomerase [Escherichia albertii]UUL44755.1 AGE family epimerase/isomerase [Escherichia albertii]
MLKQAQQFTHWMRHDALPCFLQQGVVNRDGEQCFAETVPVAPGIIRARVQTRQLYVFAHATRTGWIVAGDTINRIMETGLQHFHNAQGAFYFSDGSDSTAGKLNTYEQAFALLAFSELWALTGDIKIRQRAERLHDWMQQHLTLEEGGYALNTERPTLLSQNPHMHLFEAMLSWWAATGDARWEQEAHRLFRLFTSRFFSQQQRCLVEFFASGWRPDLPESRHIDPGHHHEWTWLLYAYEKMSGINTLEWRTALQHFIAGCGDNAQTGAVMNEINLDKSRHRAASRLWCQTERIKADVVNCLTVGQAALPTLEQHIADMLRLYIENETAGLYCDEISETGERIKAASPASTLYHLYVASRQVGEVLQKFNVGRS